MLKREGPELDQGDGCKAGSLKRRPYTSVVFHKRGGDERGWERFKVEYEKVLTHTVKLRASTLEKGPVRSCHGVIEVASGLSGRIHVAGYTGGGRRDWVGRSRASDVGEV